MRDLDGELVGGFYQAAADPALWAGAWARLLACFDAESGLIWRQQRLRDGAGAAVLDWPPVAMRAFADGLVHLEPIAAGDLASRFGALLGRPVACARVFGEGDAFAAFARRTVAGVWHTATADFVFEDFACCGIGLHRPRDAAAFSADERERLSAVARHIGAALKLERAVIAARIAEAARNSVLEGLSHGALIVDGDARPVFANAAAQALAAQGLVALDRLDGNPSVASLVRQAAAGRAGGIARLDAVACGGLAVSVSPMAPSVPEAAGLALVCLRPLAPAADVSAQQLMALFALTPAEASLVPQLLAGETAQAIAMSRGVKVATVRDQSARILAKTGAANLRALATMIAQLG